MSKQVVDDVSESVIPRSKPTEESLTREAFALGDDFPQVTARTADLLADGDEMVAFRKDAKDLAARGYAVTDAMYERIGLLAKMLIALAARQLQATVDSEAKTALAEESRQRLLAIRETLALIGAAGGLDARLFSLTIGSSTKLSVVLMAMEQVLVNVSRNLHLMPDQKRVTELCDEASTLIAVHRDSRSESKSVRNDRTADGNLGSQLERLMLDVLQYLSKQGLAAYEGDVRRRAAYTLDHVYAKRTKRVTKPEAEEPTETPVSKDEDDLT